MKKRKEPEVLPEFNPYALMDATLDEMEKKFSVNSMAIDKDEPRFSTGILRLDLMLNGGLLGGGWYTFFGGEQSAKSTTAMTVLSSIMSMTKFLGPAAYFDYEGSTQGEYIENIMHSMGVKKAIDNVFGVKDDDTNEWLVPPRVRYYSPSNGETFFNYLARLEKELPDKVRVGQNWYYVYEHTIPNKKMLKGLYDPKYLAKANRLRVPAKDGTIQAIVLCDSYPAMLPKQTEDKEEGDKSLASQARMFSEGIKRVKSLMRPKRVVVLGINQLRKIPMAMHGPTEDEPCGQALKFYTVRKDMVLFSDKGIMSAEDANISEINSMCSIQGKEHVAQFAFLGVHPCSSVTTVTGHFLSGRRHHRILALRGDCSAHWTKMTKLTNEHYIPIKLGGEVWAEELPNIEYRAINSIGQGSNNLIHHIRIPTVLTKELAYFAGNMLADGHSRIGRTVSFTNSDRVVIDRWILSVESLFDLPVNLTKKEGVYSASVYSTELTHYLTFLGLCNKSSRDKSVPWFIRKAPREFVVAFLEGLFNCDSHDKDGFVFNSTSGEVVNIVQLMLLNMGIFSVRTFMSERYQNFNDPTNPVTSGASLIITGVKNSQLFLKTFALRDAKTKTLHRMAEGDCRSALLRDIQLMLPHFSTFRKNDKHFWLWLRDKVGRETLYLSDIKKSVLSEFRGHALSLRTSQQREAYLDSLEIATRFLRYTKTNGLVWVKVSSVLHASEPVAVYDANMPETNTTVFNGIVSHNSDVRIKTSSASLSSVGVKGKGALEEEPSVRVDGIDLYRYIKVRTHKNKLGGKPSSEAFLRLVVENAEGRATGFCPTWDTYQYLKATGQISGTRKKIKFLENITIETIDRSTGEILTEVKNFDNPFAGITVSWLEFKTLVEGEKELIKDMCFKYGLSKPVLLRTWVKRQMSSGVGLELYKAMIKVSGSKSFAKSDADDAE